VEKTTQQTGRAHYSSRFGGRQFAAGLGCLAESHRTQQGVPLLVRQVAAGVTAAVMARVAGAAMGTAMMESTQMEEAQMATMQVGSRYHSRIGGRGIASLVGTVALQIWRER
jgi:hypothetical protein